MYHKGSVLGPILFSFFVNDLPLHVKIYLLIVTCWQITLHTSEKKEEDILQIRSNMQDSLDQVSNWCDNNHMVINPIKTKSMTLATRQKHQPSSLPLYPGLRRAKMITCRNTVLGITIDNKICWNSHADNVCKTV